MKKIFAIMAGVTALTAAAQMPDLTWNPAQAMDSLRTEIKAVNNGLKKQAETTDQLKKDVTAGQETAAALNDSLAALEAKVVKISTTLDNAIQKVNEELGTKIETTNSEVKSAGSVMKYVIIALVAVVVIFFAAWLMLRKRIGDGSLDLKSVKEANQRLQEQSVELDTKLAQLLEQQLTMADKIQNVTAAAGEEDHSLILSIANELMRIDQNLSFMDPKTKGVSQLRNRSAAITASLKSKGYEIPSLIGTEYRDGMNMEATMEEDDTLDSAKQIIRRVTRPAVLYKGKMIQTAAVVVAYNPEMAE